MEGFPYPIIECLSNRCQKPMFWAITEQKRTRIPLNRAPDPAGLFVLVPNPDDPLLPIARRLDNAHKRFGKTCYTTHFADCPDAGTFRRQSYR